MTRSSAACCGSIVATVCLLLLLQTRTGGTAPAQHLAISVEGNTPTLIVTSAEIGITPKILATEAKTTTTTTATTPTDRNSDHALGGHVVVAAKERGGKNAAAKLKSKSSKLQQYSKKRLQYAAKEKSLATWDESAAAKTTTTNPITTTTTIAQSTAAVHTADRLIAKDVLETTTTTIAATVANIRQPTATTTSVHTKSTVNENKQATKSTKTTPTTKTTTITTTDTSATTTSKVAATAGFGPFAPNYSQSTAAAAVAASTSNEYESTTNDAAMMATPLVDAADTPTTITTMATANLSASEPVVKQPEHIKPNAAMATTVGTLPHEVPATSATLAPGARPTEILTRTSVAASDAEAADDATITTPAKEEVSALPTAISAKPANMKTATVAATMAKIPTATQMDTFTTATTITPTTKMTQTTTSPAASELAAAAATSNAPLITTDAEAVPKDITTTTIPVRNLPTSKHGDDQVVSQQAAMVMPTTTTTETATATATTALASETEEVNASNKTTTGTTTLNNNNNSQNEQPTTAAVDATDNGNGGKSATAVTPTTHVTPTPTPLPTIPTTDTQPLTAAKRHSSERIPATTTLAPTITDNGGIVFIDAVQADEPQRQPQRQHADAADDGIVKLIDLERHDSKPIAGAQRRHPHNDSGHDGVKRTRKKQLTDKHFLLLEANDNVNAMAIDSTATIVDGTTSTTTAATTTTKETEAPKTVNGVAAGINHKSLPADNVVTTTTTMPTLVPVHNGYLGPIFMEEKTFSVARAHRKPPQHHETSIESQLRDGRIVEILAPTALLEQVTTTTTTTEAAASTTDNSQLLAETTTTRPISTTTGSALPLSHPDRIQHTPVLSTTVFQIPDTLSSTTRLPVSTQKQRNDVFHVELHQQAQQQEQPKSKSTMWPKQPSSVRTESKISDIQIEVYDSTVDSIVASTNFKDTDGFYAPPLDSAVGTTRPPAHTQERFTQYVVDRTDFSTQESSVAPLTIMSGKPEPAAIEIHINVSEGVGNESEDLEFSYRQPDYFGNAQPRSEYGVKAATSLSLKPFVSGAITRNDSNVAGNEHSDEILVVEIIDTGDNSTENSVSAENINPIFTFRSDSEADVELKDIKYYPPETLVKSSSTSDELFLADLKKTDETLSKPPPPPPPPPRKPIIDRDSDTIFYISNTEVKVGESLPTANTNTNLEQQQLQLLRKSRLENQFFPANYMASTHPNAARLDDTVPQQHRYEEDIILSPLHNTADALKIFRSQSDGAPPLDVTYVGESVMEVEQSSGAGAGGVIMTTSVPLAAASPMPDVIIQPAILPEMSIGVPVIGELPPQIELKEIDFMPDEANQLRSGVYENNIDAIDSTVDRLVESSMQYGGDLIDESAGGGGFDGIEGSYPFGNPVAMRGSERHAADYAHYSVNRGVSNLRKDELTADVASSGEIVVALAGGNTEQNGTLEELLTNRGGNETTAAALPMSMNGSHAQLTSNATARSVAVERSSAADDEYSLLNTYTLILGLIIVLLPVVITTSMACTLRYLYYKNYRNNNNDNSSSIEANDANEANGNDDAEKAKNGATHEESTQEIQFKTTQGSHNKDSTTPNPTTNDSKNSKPSNNSAENAASTLHIVGEKSAASFSLSSSSFQAKEPTSTLQCALSRTNLSSTQTESDQSNNSVQGNLARPNGSVTTMTLKNNHLIVETEERHDISRDARETKMHYNTSEKDGVFVVEVARGVDSKTIPDSPVADGSEQRLPVYEATLADATAAKLATEDEKVLKQKEEVQIHQPPIELPQCGTSDEPQRSLHQIVEVEEPSTFSPNAFARAETNLVHNSNTGLSQSDLSSSSSTDSNKRYSYGNQELYTVEPTGYDTTSPIAQPPLAAAENGIGEDDDHKSENGHSLDHSPAQTAGHAAAEQSCSKLTSEQVHSGELNVCNGPTVRPTDQATKIKVTAEETHAAAVPPPTDEIVAIDKVHATTRATETETDTATAEHEPTLNGDGESLQSPPEECNAYDSIMSLPDPPSTEEITQLYDYSITDTNQLDSLPPPPPPPPLAADVNDNTETAQSAAADPKQTPATSTLTNGNNNANADTITNGNDNGNVDDCEKAVPNGQDELSRIAAKLPPTLEMTGSGDVVSNGKMSLAPLTPPASPPTSLPAHFSSGLNGVSGMNGMSGVNGLPMPVAVDVNGS